MIPPNCNSERKIAVVFDLDKTITRSDTYISFLVSILAHRPQRIFHSLWLPFAVAIHKLGIKNNSWLKTVFFRAIVAGSNRDQMEKWVNQFITKVLAKEIYSNARITIEQHKQLGHKMILASASFDLYVNELGKQLGFDEIICTLSSWNDSNQLKGEISGTNCYGESKLNRLKVHFGSERNQWHIIGYSDHHSDEPMLNWVDEPIAVNPTLKLSQISGYRGYDIRQW